MVGVLFGLDRKGALPCSLSRVFSSSLILLIRRSKQSLIYNILWRLRNFVFHFHLLFTVAMMMILCGSAVLIFTSCLVL